MVSYLIRGRSQMISFFGREIRIRIKIRIKITMIGRIKNSHLFILYIYIWLNDISFI
jgi:hypothetical protein